jgi:hypothetical protein
MKLLWVFYAFLIPSMTSAEEVHIAVGMAQDEAVKLIRKHGGKDITAGLAVKAESGIFWELKDYDAVLALGSHDGKIVRLTYWTKKNFAGNKGHRTDAEQPITSLRLDTEKKKVSLENKTKP